MEAIIKLELDEHYFSEGYIGEELQMAIVKEVVTRIKDSLQPIAVKHIEDTIKNRYLSIVDEAIKKNIDGKTINIGNESLTLEEYIQKVFTKTSTMRSLAEIDEAITKKTIKLGKELGEELKRRYDMQFAQHIVVNMNKQNLLKDESIVKLLEGE